MSFFLPCCCPPCSPVSGKRGLQQARKPSPSNRRRRRPLLRRLPSPSSPSLRKLLRRKPLRQPRLLRHPQLKRKPVRSRLRLPSLLHLLKEKLQTRPVHPALPARLTLRLHLALPTRLQLPVRQALLEITLWRRVTPYPVSRGNMTCVPRTWPGGTISRIRTASVRVRPSGSPAPIPDRMKITSG